MMEQEKGEVEDTETKEKSDIAAGMWWYRHFRNAQYMSHNVGISMFWVSDQVQHKPGCTATENG